MASPLALGTPCLVPVRVVGVADQKVKGFITRLAPRTATLSTNPELPVGCPVSLTFKRPSDNEEVRIEGEVARLLTEGGLWRGRPAALVSLHVELGAEYFEAEDLRGETDDPPARRGSEPERGGTQPPPRTSLGGALRSGGLGRRRLAPGLADRPQVLAGGDSGSHPPPAGDAWYAPAAEDELEIAPPPNPDDTDDDLNTVVDFPTEDLQAAVADRAPDVAFSDELPPVVHSGERPALVDDVPEELDSDRFVEQFSSFEAVDEANLPPGIDSKILIAWSDEPPPFEDEAADLPRQVESDALPSKSGYFEVAGFSGPDSLLETGASPPVIQSDASRDKVALGELPSQAPPSWAQPAKTPRRIPLPSEQAPVDQAPLVDWSPEPADEDDPSLRSLIPRSARIRSALPVTYWARGRANPAEARNFSKEGCFLATADTPPVHGAVVRIEFPLDTGGETLPVRFTAEVRWHTADRPGTDLPDGFGVQILTFETPRDRERYDGLLLVILQNHEAQSRDELRDVQWT